MKIVPKVEDVLELIKQGEGLHLEMKACGDSLPNSVWETYSAFANTRGGVIILGVSEDKRLPLKSRFIISGVKDPNKIATDFFNLINNPQKVNRNILIDSDVRIINIEDKDIVYILVHEADYRQKPIYINNNLQSGTYKRVHEGDRHVNDKELALLIRDSSDDIDQQIIEHYGLEDIDNETLRGYRQNFKDSNPHHPFNNLSDNDFLIKLGGYGYDRKREIEGLTMAGLLMFGKGQSIHENFPNFRVDYLNLIGITPKDDKKWNDRLTDDGLWEDNLYNFLFLTLQKLLLTLPNEGKLEGVVRKDGGLLHQAVREALVNSITYCDYKLGGVLRIDRKTESIVMRNPGTLRISPERIYEGEYTQARNTTIQKMLRMIKLGDNIGSGFQKIMAAWNGLGFKHPVILEDYDINEVRLVLPLDQDDTKKDLTDLTEDLSDLKTDPSDQKTHPIDIVGDLTDLKVDLTDQLLSLLRKNPSIGYTRIANILHQNETKIKKLLKHLKQTNKIKRVGPTFGGYWIIID